MTWARNTWPARANRSVARSTRRAHSSSDSAPARPSILVSRAAIVSRSVPSALCSSSVSSAEASRASSKSARWPPGTAAAASAARDGLRAGRGRLAQSGERLQRRRIAFRGQEREKEGGFLEVVDRILERVDQQPRAVSGAETLRRGPQVDGDAIGLLFEALCPAGDRDGIARSSRQSLGGRGGKAAGDLAGKPRLADDPLQQLALGPLEAVGEVGM